MALYAILLSCFLYFTARTFAASYYISWYITDTARIRTAANGVIWYLCNDIVPQAPSEWNQWKFTAFTILFIEFDIEIYVCFARLLLMPLLLGRMLLFAALSVALLATPNQFFYFSTIFFSFFTSHSHSTLTHPVII